MNFETIIGLEVHVELKTDSKIFSASPNHFGADPNTNTSVIDLGYPGVLPVLNKRAVDFAMKAAMALNCQVATDTKFDRKNYFYPDNPKAYQISQFDKPIGEHGWIEIEVNGTKKTHRYYSSSFRRRCRETNARKRWSFISRLQPPRNATC